jgi:hypothetical protein
MVHKQEFSSLLARPPKAMKTWIEQEAERNGASQNSEIVRSIRPRMDADEKVLR